MKIFISIKKKWLQHRVYKYTLKYHDALSKSDSQFQLSNNYNSSAEYYKKRDFSNDIKNYINACKLCQKYKVKGEYYKHLADIYLDKKLDLEEELQCLRYPKA